MKKSLNLAPQMDEKGLNPFSCNLIYVYTRPEYPKYCKIGKASISTTKNPNELSDNCEELNSAAHKRIRNQTSDASIKYDLRFTCLAIKDNESFSDTDIHEYLKRHNVYKDSPVKEESGKNIGQEWFKISYEDAAIWINNFKNGGKYADEVFSKLRNKPKKLRPEQQDAISETIKVYNDALKNPDGDNKMLWNAIMRFGKTFAAYSFIEQFNKQETNNKINRVLILTHRPNVDEEWFTEFQNSFVSNNIKFVYSSRKRGEKWENVNKNQPYFVFLSIQDLRGKERNNFSETSDSEISENEWQEFKEKNKVYFDINWDLVIIDEAHEGNMTRLAEQMHEHIKRKFTLYLSGTPYKLLSAATRKTFDLNQVFDWDYIQEQKAKKNWENDHPDEPNPYANLPSIKINAVKIKQNFKDIELLKVDQDKMGFDFDLFFEVDENDDSKFIREADIDKWLNNMCTEDHNDLDNLSTMPYSSKNRDFNHHSLWHLPGVRQANALEKKLKSHHFFKHFTIINATGSNINGEKAKQSLKRAINEKNDPFKTWTITLSCGRLTTGVTIKEWTTVLMLSNITSAQAYMQTIFRCKTSWEYKGKIKEQGVVYDFSPNRVLEIISEYADVHSVKKQTAKEQKQSESFIKDLINYMPVISFSGNSFKPVNVDDVMEGIKKTYIQNIVRTGFNTFDVFNKTEIDKLSIEEAAFFESKISSGHSHGSSLPNKIIINENENVDNALISIDGQGDYVKINNKPKAILTPEEKEQKNKRENLKLALLKVTKRMPLMIMALNPDITNDFKLEDFPTHFTEQDWEEFMQEVTTKDFVEITRFFDKTAIQGAVKKWCNDVDNAFKIGDFEQQVLAIREMFSKIQNPDKETVLTPWNVVDIHFNATKINWKDLLKQEKGKVFLLDINSKSGIYPLYMLWSLWKYYDGINRRKDPIYIIKDHIYVNCKTDAACKITRRILGIRNKKYDDWATKHIIRYDIFKKYEEYEKEID